MSAWESLLAGPQVVRLGLALVHFLWQGALIAAGLVGVLWLLRPRSANLRYVVATLGLFALAAAPAVTFLLIDAPPTVAAAPTAARAGIQAHDQPDSTRPVRDEPAVERPLRPAGGAELAPRAALISLPAGAAQRASAVEPVPLEAAPAPARGRGDAALLRSYLPHVVSGWALGVFLLALWRLAGWSRVRRLTRREAREAPEPLRVKFAGLACRLRVSRPVRLLESAVAVVPMVVGYLRPVVLVPAAALAGLTPQQVESILAHELAHVRRHDYLVNTIQIVIETLLFYHPAVWWLSRRIRLEREACCDDAAVAACGDRLAYARALARMEELRAVPAPAVAASSSLLIDRIRRIAGLGCARADSDARRWGAWMAASLVLAALIAGPLIATFLSVSLAAGKAAPAAAEAPDDRELERLWQTIGQADHRAAFAAVDRFARGGDRAVAVLARQIEPVLREANEQGVKQLVAALDDERFRLRDRASEQIAMMGRWARPVLRTALRGAKSQEARTRLRRLIAAAESPTADTDGRRRMVRAVWVLERIGTARAKALLGAVERSPVKPHWKCFRAGEHVVEAGFLPDKVEYVWGEPMFYFTFVVRNVGAGGLQFTEGGDYRGGRSESHKITAVDANGNAVPVPEMPRMGGRMGVQKLPPGGVYLKMLPVSRRLTFSGPGVYTVTGKRTLRLGGFDRKATDPSLPVATSFRLTIHPHGEARMREVIEDLAAEVRAAGDLVPQPLEYTEPTSMSEANRLYLAFSALAGIRDPAVVKHLVAMANDAPRALRVAALKRLGEVAGPEALAALLRALRDEDTAIRAAAAAGLGATKSDTAVDALLATLPKQDPAPAAAVLGAMGATRSPRVLPVLVRSLSDEDAQRRRGAVEGLVAFGGPEAIKALQACTSDNDMGFRELVVKTLAESLRQPIDAQWLVPVILARKSVGDAGRLMRLYAGPKAVPALLSCLDPNDPRVRAYYNASIVGAQGSCRGGLRIPWISDLNRNGRPEEIEQNRKTLKALRAWVEHYYRHRLDEKPPPPYGGWREEDKTWGEPVDGISIRIRVNQRVWPEGMPQVVYIDVRGHPGEGTVHLSKLPELLEVEINGHWYARHPPPKGTTMGISPGHGASFHNVRLGEKWRRPSDGKPLQLAPGKYTIRARLSTTPEDRRTGLAVSKPIHFEIIPTLSPPAGAVPAPATQPAEGKIPAPEGVGSQTEPGKGSGVSATSKAGEQPTSRKAAAGYLGVNIQGVDDKLAKSFKLPGTDGALVTEVFKDSPAERAGVIVGDFIVAVDGKAVKNVTALASRIAAIIPGTKIKLDLYRDGKKRTVAVIVGRQPPKAAVTTAVYRLEHARAADVGALLWKLLKGVGPIAVQADAPSNSLIVSAPAKERRRIEAIITRLDQPVPKPPTTQPGERASFGPVIERVVNHTNENCLIDFDTGKLLTPPKNAFEGGSMTALVWAENNGVDAGGGAQETVQGLIGFDIIAFPRKNEAWEKLSPQSLAADRDNAFKLSKPGNPVFLSAKGGVPATFTFQTREGGVGILQILQVNTAKPKSIKIRYKMLRPHKPTPKAAQPATRPAGDSRAWQVLREGEGWGHLLAPLPRQLRKFASSSDRSGPVWRSVKGGGRAKLDIVTEGDTKGQIVVGLFSNPAWASPPAAVRTFPGPGQYTVSGLPPGEWHLGAIADSVSGESALGVSRSWPNPLQIRPAQTTPIRLLVSSRFRYSRTSGKREAGRADRDNLLKGKLTAPDGKPIAYATVQIREFSPDGVLRGCSDVQSDEKGLYSFDQMKWPYRVGAIWYEPLPLALGFRHQYIGLNRMFKGRQTVDFPFETFPKGSAVLTGKVVDQHGQPLKRFFLDVRNKVDWMDRSGKSIYQFGYRLPFLSADGTFRLANLPAGKYEVGAHLFPTDSRVYRGAVDYCCAEGEATLRTGGATHLKLTFTKEKKKIYYGRALFENGRAAFLHKPPWPGGQVHVILSSREPPSSGSGDIASVDRNGYFALPLWDVELTRLKARQSELVICVPIPNRAEHSNIAGRFPANLLSTKRHEVGVVRINAASPSPKREAPTDRSATQPANRGAASRPAPSPGPKAAAAWKRSELLKGRGITVRVAVKPEASPADEEWLRLEFENAGPTRTRVASAQYYINRRTFDRATGRAVGTGSLASGNTFDMFPHAWRTTPASPIFLERGTYVLGDQPSSDSTALLGMPPKTGWRIEARVNALLRLADGSALATPPSGIGVSFQWLYPDPAGLAAMRDRLKTLLQNPLNRSHHGSILAALLRLPDVRRAVSAEELLRAAAKRKGPFDGRQCLAAHLNRHFANSPAVAEFYISGLQREDWQAAEDLAGPATAIWDDRFIEPLLWMHDAAGSSYPKHRSVLTALGRHQARWEGDASVARRLFAAVRRGFAGVLIRPEELEASQLSSWWAAVGLVGMTRAAEAVKLLRPFLDSRTVVGGRGLSAYRPPGAVPIPIRACDAAHDAIQTLLGRRDRRLLSAAAGWGLRGDADVQKELARRDKQVKALRAALAGSAATKPAGEPRAPKGEPARGPMGRAGPRPRPTVTISIRQPGMVDMPVWVYVETDDRLLAANLRYPFHTVPWAMGPYGFEVRRKGKVLPPRRINRNIGRTSSFGSVAPPGSPTGRLPLHLLYRFPKPGKYEVRLLVYRSPAAAEARDAKAVIATSDWLGLDVQPLPAGRREEWLKKVTAVPPKDFGQLVGDYLPSLLACAHDAVARVLEEMLYHESDLVQRYALYSLWSYYDDRRLKKDIAELVKKRGPTVPLAYFLSWRRDLFADRAAELAQTCMAALRSPSSATVEGGMQALVFLKAHFDWTRQPDVPAKMDDAVFAAADKLARTPGAVARLRLCCYLGGVKTDASRKLLWKLTEDPLAREQAMICLCWIANRQDLPGLAEVLMTGGKGARALPYHLFRAYGKESLPYIQKAVQRSPDPQVRGQCRQVIQNMSKRPLPSTKSTTQPADRPATQAPGAGVEPVRADDANTARLMLWVYRTQPAPGKIEELKKALADSHDRVAQVGRVLGRFGRPTPIGHPQLKVQLGRDNRHTVETHFPIPQQIGGRRVMVVVSAQLAVTFTGMKLDPATSTVGQATIEVELKDVMTAAGRRPVAVSPERASPFTCRHEGEVRLARPLVMVSEPRPDKSVYVVWARLTADAAPASRPATMPVKVPAGVPATRPATQPAGKEADFSELKEQVWNIGVPRVDKDRERLPNSAWFLVLDPNAAPRRLIDAERVAIDTRVFQPGMPPEEIARIARRGNAYVTFGNRLVGVRGTVVAPLKLPEVELAGTQRERPFVIALRRMSRADVAAQVRKYVTQQKGKPTIEVGLVRGMTCALVTPGGDLFIAHFGGPDGSRRHLVLDVQPGGRLELSSAPPPATQRAAERAAEALGLKLPVQVTEVSFIHDGGTTAVRLVDAGKRTLRVFMDRRKNSRPPRHLFTGAYPGKEGSKEQPIGGRTEQAVFALLQAWVDRQADPERQARLRLVRSVVGLSEEDLKLLRVIRVIGTLSTRVQPATQPAEGELDTLLRALGKRLAGTWTMTVDKSGDWPSPYGWRGGKGVHLKVHYQPMPAPGERGRKTPELWISDRGTAELTPDNDISAYSPAKQIAVWRGHRVFSAPFGWAADSPEYSRLVADVQAVIKATAAPATTQPAADVAETGKIVWGKPIALKAELWHTPESTARPAKVFEATTLRLERRQTWPNIDLKYRYQAFPKAVYRGKVELLDRNGQSLGEYRIDWLSGSLPKDASGWVKSGHTGGAPKWDVAAAATYRLTMSMQPLSRRQPAGKLERTAWSEAVNGLQSRLLVDRTGGFDEQVYLELRNTSHKPLQIPVYPDGAPVVSLKFEGYPRQCSLPRLHDLSLELGCLQPGQTYRHKLNGKHGGYVFAYGRKTKDGYEKFDPANKTYKMRAVLEVDEKDPYQARGSLQPHPWTGRVVTPSVEIRLAARAEGRHWPPEPATPPATQPGKEAPDSGETGPSEVDRQIELLGSNDRRVRVAAAEALGGIGPAAKTAVGDLIRALADKESEVRYVTATALGEIGPAAKDAVPALIAALGDERGWLKWAAARALVYIDPAAAAKHSLPRLCEALASRHDDVRGRAAVALGDLGRSAVPAVPALIRALRDKQATAYYDEPWIVRRHVAVALGKIGPEAGQAASALVEASQDKDQGVREAAVEALKRIRAGAATRPAVKWGRAVRGLRCGLTTNKPEVPMGSKVDFTLHLQFDPKTADPKVGVLNRTRPHVFKVDLTFTDTKTGKTFRRAAFDNGMIRPQVRVPLRGKPLKPEYLEVYLLTHAGKQLPAGAYSVTATCDVDPSRVQVAHPPAKDKSRAWVGKIISGPVHLTVTPARPRTVKLKVPASLVFLSDNGRLAWDFSEKDMAVVSLRVRPGFNLTYRLSSHLLLNNKAVMRSRGGGSGGYQGSMGLMRPDRGNVPVSGAVSNRVQAGGRLKVVADLEIIENSAPGRQGWSPVGPVIHKARLEGVATKGTIANLVRQPEETWGTAVGGLQTRLAAALDSGSRRLENTEMFLLVRNVSPAKIPLEGIGDVWQFVTIKKEDRTNVPGLKPSAASESMRLEPGVRGEAATAYLNKIVDLKPGTYTLQWRVPAPKVPATQRVPPPSNVLHLKVARDPDGKLIVRELPAPVKTSKGNHPSAPPATQPANKPGGAIPADIEPLIERLQSSRVEERSGAARQLGLLGDAAKTAADALADAARDKNPQVNAWAVWALAKVHDRRAVGPMIRHLKKPKDNLYVPKTMMLSALEDLDDPRIAPAMIELLRDKDMDVRRHAAAVLVKHPDERAVGPLIEALTHGYVRETATEALARIGPSATKALLAAADRPSLRWQAIAALGRMGPAAKDAVPLLIRALSDRRGQVREAAAGALGDIRDPRAVDPLIAAYRSAPKVRPTPLNVHSTGTMEVRKGPLLSFEDEYLAARATEALVRIGPATVPGLVKVLTDPDPRMREWAVRILGRVASGSKEAIAALRAAMHDDDRLVARAASEAIRSVEAATRAATQPAIDLDATARLLEKAVGGKWQKDLHSGLHISRRILCGEVRSKAGKVLVRYHVFPFGRDDENWPRWQRWLQRSYAQIKGARVLGAGARCSVVELARDPEAAGRYSQAVKKALGLSLPQGAPPAGRMK